MTLPRAPLAALFTLALAACDNPDQTANGLFVEASQAVAQAVSEADIVKQHSLLVTADSAATRITTDYPGTNAAVRIASNEKLGPYTLSEIKTTLKTLEAKPELCLRSITASCMTSVITGAVQYLSTLDRKSQPDPERITIAVNGWPFLAATEPSLAANVLPASPTNAQFINELTQIGFGFNGSTLKLITMIYEANGEAAAIKFVTALSQTPPFKAQLEASLPKLASAFFTTATPERAKAARAVIRAISDPLSPEIATDVDKTLCSLGYNDEQRAAVMATCTPEQILMANTSFYALTPELYDRLFAAAETQEQKTNVARSAYDLAKGGIAQHLSWYEAAGYENDVKQIVMMYVEATRDGHPARPTLITRLEQLKEPHPDDALTRINISERTLALIHANGALADQLPAIYAHLKSNAAYTYPLERVITTLFSLQPLTPGMDLGEFADVIGSVVHSWPETNSSNRNSFSLRIQGLANKALKDPKPIYDRFYKTLPYHQNLGVHELRTFRENGHTDIYDAAVKASKPINEMNSTLFYLVQEDVLDAVKAQDITAITTLLDKQDRMVRYFLVRNILSTGHLGTRTPVSDTVRNALLEKYTYDAVANELGWHNDLKVPFQTKKAVIFEQFAALTEFKVYPHTWLVASFGTFSPEDRVRALRLLRDTNNETWPLYATAIVATQSSNAR